MSAALKVRSGDVIDFELFRTLKTFGGSNRTSQFENVSSPQRHVVLFEGIFFVGDAKPGRADESFICLLFAARGLPES